MSKMPNLAASATEMSLNQEPMASMKADLNRLLPVCDLHCYACSPVPTFTNTSHLLTHLASKTHLRKLFELELLATYCHDEKSIRSLDKFHKWFFDEHIGEHLVDRFIIKKGKGPKGKKINARQEEERVDQPNKESLPVNEPVATQHQEVDCAPPQRPGQSDKKRKLDDTERALREALDPENLARQTPNPPRTTSGVIRNGRRQALTTIINEATVTPGSQRTGDEQPAAPIISTPSSESSFGSVKDDLGPAASAQEADQDETVIVDGPDRGVTYSSRGPRLRGKIWPGMGVFDIAAHSNTGRRVSTSSQNTSTGASFKSEDCHTDHTLDSTRVHDPNLDNVALSQEHHGAVDMSATGPIANSVNQESTEIASGCVLPPGEVEQTQCAPALFTDTMGKLVNDIGMSDLDIDMDGNADLDPDFEFSALRNQLSEANSLYQNNTAPNTFNSTLSTQGHEQLNKASISYFLGLVLLSFLNIFNLKLLFGG